MFRLRRVLRCSCRYSTKIEEVFHDRRAKLGINLDEGTFASESGPRSEVLPWFRSPRDFHKR